MSGYSQLNTVSFSEFVSLTRTIFKKGGSLIKDYENAKSLFKMVDIPKNTGNTRKFYEVDSEQFAKYKAEGANSPKVKAIMGYTKTMTKRRMSAEIDITYEMRNENRAPEMVQKLTDLSKHCPNRMALDLTHTFSFCTATSYTDMDGETVDTTVGDTNALVDATHDLTGSTTTYSNIITGNPRFAKGAFQVARERARTQTLDNFGIPVVYDYNTVISSGDPTTVDEIQILKRSKTDPTQDNSGVVNTYSGTFRHVILERLDTTATGAYDSTKSKYWGWAAIGAGSDTWMGYFGVWESPNLKTPKTANNGEDIHTDDWTFGARCGYGIVAVSGRGIVWSTGVGA